MSEVTQESFPEGFIVQSGAGNAMEDLVDFEKLKEQTQKKLKILESEKDMASMMGEAPEETSDEFLRNFFIKFGMKSTLESFQTEWFELKTKGELDVNEMPEIP